MKYQIVENMFPCSRHIIEKGLTFDDASSLAKKWNIETDCYVDYEIEEREQTIKDIRKNKLEQIENESR